MKVLYQHVVKATSGSSPCWWRGHQSAICIYDMFKMTAAFSLAAIRFAV